MESIELLELKDITTRLFGGYDKKSVKKYITRIISENDEELSAMRKKADELEKKNAALAKENESVSLELWEHRQKTEEISKNLMDQLSSQVDQIMQLSQQVAKHHQSETEYQKKIEEIAQAVILIEKRKEAAERQSEEIMSGARLAAKVEVEKARREADELLGDARRVRERADRESEEIMSGTRLAAQAEVEKARREADELLGDARRVREQADRESAQMIEEATQKRNQLLGSFGQAMNRFHELYDHVGHILEQEQQTEAGEPDENNPAHPSMRVV